MITLQGSAYVLGGSLYLMEKTAIDTVLMFEMDSCSWIRRAPMPRALCSHGAVVLNDAATTAMVCGGRARDNYSAQATCFMYSALDDVWTTVASLNTPRYFHGMAVYKGGIVFCNKCIFLRVQGVYLPMAAWMSNLTIWHRSR
jgi:hypothetical protein